jgi:hypothetical protein
MIAAASAAKGVQALSDHPGFLGGPGVALTLVVAGGLVEGSAIGLLQGGLLAERWPRLRRRTYVAITLVVAGLGWAAGSVPGVLSGDEAGSQPPLLLMLAGAAAIGLAMGPLLGAAQAWALRGTVPHPWRWVAANTVAWPPVMMVIFFGASRPESGWSVPAVVATGAVTGVVAGTVLGWVVTGQWLSSLDGQPVHNRVVLALVQARRFGMDRGTLGLAVSGRRSANIHRFPVQYAEDDAGLVVVPGHPEQKQWWRNLGAGPTELEVLLDGEWRVASAVVLGPGDRGRAAAVLTYRRRWPRIEVAQRQPIVRIVLVQHHSRMPAGLNDRSRSTTASREPKREQVQL